MPSTSSPTATMTEQSCKDDVAYVSNLLRSDFSFVPTTKEVDALQYCATKASQDIVQNTKTQRLSKLWSQDFASKVGLVPSTFSPQHTVLSKAGAAAVRSRQNEGATTILSDNGWFTVIKDQTAPFWTSFGVNGVLIKYDEPGLYGRINLFCQRKNDIQSMLSEYLQFRDKNITAIFKLFADSIQDCIDRGYRPRIGKDEVLDLDEQRLFDAVSAMMHQVSACILKIEKAGTHGNQLNALHAMGMDCESYCQTWIRKGQPVGAAEFSVMSPHFQTWFYVTNYESLQATTEVSTECLRAYDALCKRFRRRLMFAGYGGAPETPPAFVSLDGLHRSLQANNVSVLAVPVAQFHIMLVLACVLFAIASRWYGFD
eukprot:m.419775 g.419775  ORF g.419775 m.419775 type:complete len:371 (-) comp21309_c0_seq3:1134-2246(-)